jgi:hypothetical protein
MTFSSRKEDAPTAKTASTGKPHTQEPAPQAKTALNLRQNPSPQSPAKSETYPRRIRVLKPRILPPATPAAFFSFSFKCQPRRLVNYLRRKAEEKSEDFSMEDDARREV